MWRRLVAVAISLLFVILFASFLWGNLSTATQSNPETSVPTSTIPVEVGEPATAATKPAAAQPPPTGKATTFSPTTNLNNLVAIVNGEAITPEQLAQLQASDQAVALLLGQPSSNQDKSIDRLVNSLLVKQAATAANFRLESGAATSSLKNFLASQGKSEVDLANALQAAGLEQSIFLAYFSDLLLVDAFSRREAKKQGIATTEYLLELQTKAQISYGPLATQPIAFAPLLPAVVEPTPTSQPTGEPRDEIAVGRQPGQRAPDFVLPALSPTPTITLSALRGQPVVLSFWTTWCPYCRQQTAVLVDAANQYPAIRFLGIDVKEGEAAVQAYVNQEAIPYPILLDKEGAIAESYGVTGFPTTYFLDADGLIVARQLGALNVVTLERLLARLAPN